MMNASAIKDRIPSWHHKEKRRREEEAKAKTERVEDLAKFLEQKFSPDARRDAVNGPSFSDLAEAKRRAEVALKR